MAKVEKKNPLKKIKTIRPSSIDNLGLVGYFDGVAREKGLTCRAIALIYIDNSHNFHIYWNCGRVINTCGDLLALWVLLWT